MENYEKVFLATDHHFNHANIIKFGSENGGTAYRDFETIQKHDDYLIECHNRVVQDDDTVIFLGDLGGDKTYLETVLPRMRGRKKLVMGNHDKYSVQFYAKHFERIRAWYLFGEKGKPHVIATHFPLMPESFHPDKPWLNVHGHVHINSVTGPIEDKYLNICPERWNYTPTRVSEFLDIAKKRNDEGRL